MLTKHSVIIEEPHIQSLAALVLLQKRYREEILHEYLQWRDKFLSKFDVLTCFWCGKTGLLPETETLSQLATIDHIIPVSRGGEKMNEKNCIVSCHKCNVKRGNQDFIEYLNKKKVNPIIVPEILLYYKSFKERESYNEREIETVYC